MSIAHVLMDIPRAWARSSNDKIGNDGNCTGVVCLGEQCNCGSADNAVGRDAALQQGTGGGGAVKGTGGGGVSGNGGGDGLFASGGGGGAFLQGIAAGCGALTGGGALRGGGAFRSGGAL